MLKTTARVDIAAYRDQLRALSKGVRRKVPRRAVTKGGQAYVAVAKDECPIRDTSAALKSAGVKIRVFGKKVKRGIGTASYMEHSDKRGKLVQIKYNGGLLRKAQGSKVKMYRDIGVGICGTRDGFRQQIGVRQSAGVRRKDTIKGKKNTRKLARAGEPIYADPAKYAHLIIGGKGRGAFKIAGSKFHQHATNAAGNVCVGTAQAETVAAIEEAARK